MVACSVTGVFVFLEIQKEKEGMKSILYLLELGATAACTKILMEEMKGLGQRSMEFSTRYFSCSAVGSCKRKQKKQPPPLVLI